MSGTTQFDWQKERTEMAADVRRYILDPMALVARWIGDTDASKFDPTPEEISRLLFLLIMGAHNELDMYCSVVAGHMTLVTTDILETELKRQWTGKGVKS